MTEFSVCEDGWRNALQTGVLYTRNPLATKIGQRQGVSSVPLLSCRRRDFSPRLFFSIILLTLFTAPLSAQKVKPAAVLKGSDVMATVEGQAITRRELTYYWIQVDLSLPAKLGALLAERWKSDRGQSHQYAISDAEIYKRLYDAKADYASTLDGLMTTRLVAITAKRRGIVVTNRQVKAQARELFDAYRKQTGTKSTDAEVMAQFHVPRDVFMQDVTSRVQEQALLAQEFARRNGHPIGPNDWIEVRALFAKAEDLGEPVETEKQFAAAKARLTAWQAEIAAGKSFAEVAKTHNEDSSADTGGLHGLSLRGTGTPDNLLFTLKPGQISPPIRVKNGWFVFTAARSGKAIPEAERRAAWQAVAAAALPAYLDALRRGARIKKNF